MKGELKYASELLLKLKELSPGIQVVWSPHGKGIETYDVSKLRGPTDIQGPGSHYPTIAFSEWLAFIRWLEHTVDALQATRKRILQDELKKLAEDEVRQIDD